MKLDISIITIPFVALQVLLHSHHNAIDVFDHLYDLDDEVIDVVLPTLQLSQPEGQHVVHSLDHFTQQGLLHWEQHQDNVVGMFTVNSSLPVCCL